MTMTIEEAAEKLAADLDIPTPDGESSIEFRLSFAKLQRISDLKTELLRLATSRTLRARYPDGGCLPENSEVSESSQVDIAEAQTALEAMGWTFASEGISLSSEAPESAVPIETLKSAALVKEFLYIWPSIEGDIRDKTRHANTLLNEANIKHGYYDVEKALRWAKTEGKITKLKAETYCKTSTDSVFSAIIGQIYNLN
jgi:hypothetical protein